MIGKLILAFGMILIMSGTTFMASAAPAAVPQGNRSQDQTAKEMQERMVREANKKRQQDIRDDTDRLFELATELKAAVDKSNENLLSLDVVRKADDVEKLAKKVKEKMKEAVGPPSNEEPFPRRPRNPFPR